ncbi:DUF6350 family protein [Cryobacterium tagatosivorans]|uniref:Uncharacterized protein n=1 Tax=Cryobacterium tagatosivorans TaxID=1259199 RepID=A0A4R8UB18_9MICO|nr:DUF6350 family protein [Cryobacterium tagatosivorans]TFB47385.1 hypothetical protein E3O23_14995 [Cryobacterium tagatosivorans]
MNRITTALLAALEALIVVAIGIGIALVPLTILWATQFDLGVDWLVFWRAAADAWLLGNGVDLHVQLGPGVVAALGMPAALEPFPVTIALLGVALIACLFGVRTGRRVAETPHRWVGVASAVATYGLLATLVTLSAGTELVRPSVPQGIILPTLVYALGVLAGSLEGPGSVGMRARFAGLHARTRTVAAAALRGGTAAALGVIAVSAAAVAVLTVVNYATVIGLYETLQAGVMGGIALTLAQLALIPNLVIWAAAWFVGPGIALGVGTSVSPVGTSLGAVPGLPILGVLPHGTLELGFVGLLVPVLIGFGAARLTRRLADAQGSTGAPAPGAAQRLLTGLAMGLVGGSILGLLAWWSAGAMGPGRLAAVGPNPLLVGALAAVEIGLAAGLGLLVGGRAVTLPAPESSWAKR